MGRFKKIVVFFLLIGGLAISCSEKESTTEVIMDSPTAAMLIFPDKNTECNEGVIVSKTETDVLFKWGETANTSAYRITITNLNDATSRAIRTTKNEFLVRSLRGTPYSWVVKSEAIIGDETADSETWKFYNAGLPEESHPPFPAEVISPQIGMRLDPGEIVLQWEASDIDNDIAFYTILLDTSNSPETVIGATGTNRVKATVASGLIYYWKVITTDALGNVSYSQTFQFRVN
ncbi:hypothetical protein PI23P_12377 [Polaribacter irgensii 23-P]|uniref:Fibronectin type-III domain-containing protein n=1 Tax=Polaribacter irgensii 23-P TaxID=313594 RepID=A4C1X8_9FLAO|nr:hypothetical protein [Polaribacter irgensii]EAR12131.1 hypothetical protein PI23P_12377 [Polaribacter irgensii 23-P]